MCLIDYKSVMKKQILQEVCGKDNGLIILFNDVSRFSRDDVEDTQPRRL